MNVRLFVVVVETIRLFCDAVSEHGKPPDDDDRINRYTARVVLAVVYNKKKK